MVIIQIQFKSSSALPDIIPSEGGGERGQGKERTTEGGSAKKCKKVLFHTDKPFNFLKSLILYFQFFSPSLHLSPARTYSFDLASINQTNTRRVCEEKKK